VKPSNVWTSLKSTLNALSAGNSSGGAAMPKKYNSGRRRRVEAEGFVSLMRYIYAEDRSSSKYWPMPAQEV